MILIWERARFLASVFLIYTLHPQTFRSFPGLLDNIGDFQCGLRQSYIILDSQKTELGEELLMRFFNLIYHSCEPPDWRSTRLMLGIRRKSLRCKFKKPEHTELKLSASQQKRVRKYVISQFLELTLYEQYPLTPSSTDTQHAQLYIGTFMTGSTNHKYILIKGTHFNLRIHLCAPHPCVFTCPPCVLSPELSLWGETALFFAVRGAHQGHQE